MYAVVGCSSCGALWMLEGRQETARCPRCETTHRYGKLKRFVETDDPDHAREVRASMLASRGGDADAFAAVDSFADLESQVEAPVVDDEQYLEGSGLDSEEIAAVDAPDEPSKSRREVVLEAVERCEEPTAESIASHATDRGVPAEYVDRALEKLVRGGELTESGGRYRRL
jgi:hypothetical protein